MYTKIMFCHFWPSLCAHILTTSFTLHNELLIRSSLHSPACVPLPCRLHPREPAPPSRGEFDGVDGADRAPLVLPSGNEGLVGVGHEAHAVTPDADGPEESGLETGRGRIGMDAGGATNYQNLVYRVAQKKRLTFKFPANFL